MESELKSFKKLPYSSRSRFKWIIILTTLSVYIGTIVFTKMQTKLYKSAASINLISGNSLIFEFINKTSAFDFEKTIRNVVYSDTLLAETVKDLNLNANSSDLKNVINALKNRINFEKNGDNLFSVSIVSSHPEKSAKIINVMVNKTDSFFSAELQKEIEKLKKEIFEFNRIISNSGSNDSFLLPLKNEYEKKVELLETVFKAYPVKLKITDAEVPRRPIYPAERQSALIGLLLGFVLGLFFAVSVMAFEFIKKNSISFFEER